MYYLVTYSKNGSSFNERFQKFDSKQKVLMDDFINKKVLAGFECNLYTRDTGFKLDQQIKEFPKD